MVKHLMWAGLQMVQPLLSVSNSLPQVARSPGNDQFGCPAFYCMLIPEQADCGCFLDVALLLSSIFPCFLVAKAELDLPTRGFRPSAAGCWACGSARVCCRRWRRPRPCPRCGRRCPSAASRPGATRQGDSYRRAPGSFAWRGGAIPGRTFLENGLVFGGVGVGRGFNVLAGERGCWGSVANHQRFGKQGMSFGSVRGIHPEESNISRSPQRKVSSTTHCVSSSRSFARASWVCFLSHSNMIFRPQIKHQRP